MKLISSKSMTTKRNQYNENHQQRNNLYKYQSIKENYTNRSIDDNIRQINLWKKSEIFSSHLYKNIKSISTFFKAQYSKVFPIQKTKSPLPCFVSTHQNILLSSGKYKSIKDIQIHDRILDANGQPQTVKYIDHIDNYIISKKVLDLISNSPFSNATDLCFLRTRRSRIDIVIPQFNYILTQHDHKNNLKEWKRVYYLMEENVGNKKDKHVFEDKNINVVLFDPHYELPRNIMDAQGNVFGYTHGFVLGAFLTCGSTFYTKDFQEGKSQNDFMHVQFYCDTSGKYYQKLKQCLQTSLGFYLQSFYDVYDGLDQDKYEDLDIFEETIPFSNITKIIVRSSHLAKFMIHIEKNPLFSKGRQLPNEFYCTSYPYVKGFYDAISQSNHYYSTEMTYNLLLYLESILGKKDIKISSSLEQEIYERGHINRLYPLLINFDEYKKENHDTKTDIYNKNINAMSLIITDTIDKCTTVVCDTIPMSTYDPSE